MRKAVSLLMVGSVLLVSAGCAPTGAIPPVPAPAVSESAPSSAVPSSPTPPSASAAPSPTAPPPTAAQTPKQPGPLPAPAVKQDDRWLYPAYAFVGGGKWGYVDPAGKFVVQPAFDQAAEFEADGLAIVRQGDKSGLINKDGTLVVAPAWTLIDPANADLVRVLSNGEAGQVVDGAGKLLFDTPHVTGNFGSGLAPHQNEDGRFGYVNRKGEVVIPAQFRRAYAFLDGKAIVQPTEATFAVIDTAGNQLGALNASWVTDLSENLVAFQDKSSDHRWGYASVAGQTDVPAKFELAGPFQDGLAVVGTPGPNYHPVKGLINTRGEFVIPAEYGALVPLGAGLYASAKPTQFPTPDRYLPMALLTPDGRQLTDFLYYNPQPAGRDLISVSDGSSTFFLDRQGKPASGMPSVPGIGTLKLTGSLIKADVDGRVSYLEQTGRVVWQGDNTIPLAGGLRVIEQKYQPDPPTLIFYPDFAGLADPKAQEALNQRLRKEFTADSAGQPRDAGKPAASTDFGFSVRQINGLVIIDEQGYWYQFGAAHGLPTRNYYHIDAKTGQIYTLADLFKKDSQFTDRLREIIRQQITTRTDQSLHKNPQVAASQPFYVSADALTIYYYPYDIASYAQGFIEFPIPWSDISDLIDTNGPFWKSFH